MKILISATEHTMLLAMKARLGGEHVTPLKLHGAAYYQLPRGESALIFADSGLGLVQAAAFVQRSIDMFRGDDFDLVIHVGTAGGLGSVKTGEFVAANRTVQHDLDLTPLGMPEYEIPRSDPSASAIAADLFEHLRRGTFEQLLHIGGVASGSQYVVVTAPPPNSLAKANCLCVDMEASAVNTICAINSVPSLLLLRVIAEDGKTSPFDYHSFLKTAGLNAGGMIEHLLTALDI